MRGRDLPEPAGGWPTVSVVVPAHDEQRVIDACCRSLRAQDYPELEIVFVLDRCTDRTAALLAPHAAEDPRVRLVEIDRCPDDWAGKCHAASRGAAVARGEMLLFTDADTDFAPDLVRAAVAYARHERRDLLSLLSTLTDEHRFERIAQPVASLQLAYLYPIERVNRREDPRPFANGQFLLFERAAYEGVGGHAGVKDDLLEDIAFARAIHEREGSGAILLADGMLRCSMYDSAAAFRTGWKRIFIEACKRSPGRLRKYAARLLLLGVLLPAAQVGALAGGVALLATHGATHAPIAVGAIAAALVGLVLHGLTLAGAYRLAGARGRDAIWFPVGAMVIVGILLAAASDLVHRRPVRWGGRSYVLEPTRG